MDHLFTLASLLGVAAITPGPNNLVVLRAAGQAGMRGALPAIAGVVLGGLLLLAVIALGAGSLFAAYPSLQRWIAVMGALYLAALGITLFMRGVTTPRAGSSTTEDALPAGTVGLVGFQFLNPKSWVMVLTALATVPAVGLHGYLPLAGLFVLIPTLCLLLWAALGAWLARWLVRPTVRRAVDAAMGALLVACAVFLLP
ncbi:LysE family translocator [Rhodanobacter sp. Col0626]|uniref:LysE family translocator n=1 Tax=Rhodanobacter sp. Col0626 TaxID=3415679 RepID=UPI003CEC804C